CPHSLRALAPWLRATAPYARRPSAVEAAPRLWRGVGPQPSHRPRARSPHGEAAPPARRGARLARRRGHTRCGARPPRARARARPAGTARTRFRARASTRVARAIRSTRCSSLETAEADRAAARPGTSAGAKPPYERNATRPAATNSSFFIRHLLGRGSEAAYGTGSTASTAPSFVTDCYLDIGPGCVFEVAKSAASITLARASDIVTVCYLVEGGRRTANSSVTSSHPERKRNTAAGRPPPRPAARRSPVLSITPRRRSTRCRLVAETSCPSAAA